MTQGIRADEETAYKTEYDKLFIGGKWVEPSTSDVIEVHSGIFQTAAVSWNNYDPADGADSVTNAQRRWSYVLGGMVEKNLEEKRLAELRKEIVEQEPENIWDIPF